MQHDGGSRVYVVERVTSSLPIKEIAAGALRPQNVIGRHYFSPVQKMPLLDVGFSGRKGGEGFYLYSGSRKRPNPEIKSFFSGSNRTVVSSAEIQQRLCLALVNEAILCLQEGLLASPRDGDLGAVLGLWFPPFLGGPFRYADSLGLEELEARLDSLYQQHGNRFQPAGLIGEMARRKGAFFHDG